MAKEELPSPEYLRKRFDYNPDTGVLTWRDCIDMPQKWRTRHAGKEAFTAKTNDYKRGALGKFWLRAHRVAWAIHYGKWPKGEIDHINGDRSDNRIKNLRDVNRSENMRNASLPKTNTSGVLGVYWCRRRKVWQARIIKDSLGSMLSLGYYKRKEDAISARKAAEAKYGYHSNHGRR